MRQIMRWLLTWVLPMIIVGGLVALGWWTMDFWRPWLLPTTVAGTDEADHAPHPEEAPATLKLTDSARANLQLQTAIATLTTYWRTVEIPGTIVERPGFSHRGLTSPLAGVVTKINAVPGDTLKPGETLFTLRVISETLQTSQAQLYKTARDLEINAAEQARLNATPDADKLFRSRLIELGYERKRLAASLDTYRQDLIARSLDEKQIEQIIQGNFVTEISIRIPQRTTQDSLAQYELEELKVQMGELVQPGQTMALIAAHDQIEIEGHAFEHEASLLRQAALKGLQLQWLTADNRDGIWNATMPELRIRFVANHVDPATRMFSFYIPLDNQFREMKDSSGKVKRLWRFRPGQRVRVGVPEEPVHDVFVLPTAAVVREGLEVWVFRVNGNLLVRRPVHLLLDDGQTMVIANDGGITVGNLIVMNQAASLQRAIKAQSMSDAGHGHGHDHAHDH